MTDFARHPLASRASVGDIQPLHGAGDIAKELLGLAPVPSGGTRLAEATQTLPGFTPAATSTVLVQTESTTSLGVFTQEAWMGATPNHAQSAQYGDPHYADVLVMLRGGELVDRGPAAHTISTAGVGLGTGGGVFEFTSATTGWVETEDYAEFDVGAGEFCIEADVDASDFTTRSAALSIIDEFAQPVVTLFTSDALVPRLAVTVKNTAGVDTTLVSSAWAGAVSPGQHRFALTRTGDTLRLFLDRALVGTTAFTGSVKAGWAFRIFVQGTLAWSPGGYTRVSNARVSSSSRYTDAYTRSPAETAERLGADNSLAFTQVATATMSEVRLLTNGAADPYRGNVTYLLHGDSHTIGGPLGYLQPDDGPLSIPFDASYGPSVVDATAYGGKTIEFNNLQGCFATTSSDLQTLTNPGETYVGANNYGTTELRFEAVDIRRGWFVSSQGVKLGLSGRAPGTTNNVSADYIFTTAPETNWTYRLQIQFGVYVPVPPDFATYGEHFGRLTLVAGQKYHIAIIQDDRDIRVYLDGVLDIAFTLPADAVWSRSFAKYLTIGELTRGLAFNADRFFQCRFEEVRHTQGVVRYTGGVFDAPTAPHQGAPDVAPFGTFTQLATLDGAAVVGETLYVFADQTLPAFAPLPLRSLSANQTLPAFTPLALRSVSATQTIPPFLALNTRFVSADQTIPDFPAQVARSVAADQLIPAFTQYTEAGRSVTADQTLDAFVAAQTALSRMALGVRQTSSLGVFEQNASAISIVRASGTPTLPAFAQRARALHQLASASQNTTLGLITQLATVGNANRASANSSSWAFTQEAEAEALAQCSADATLPVFRNRAKSTGSPYCAPRRCCA